MRVLVFHLAVSLLVLTGCASPRVARDIPVSAAALRQARVQLENEVGLMRSAYEQAQRMATQGHCSEVRPYEPFILMTTGHVGAKQLPDEMRAAYVKLGVDHKVRVVWVDPTVKPNLEVGDIVTEINGRDIEADVPYSPLVALRKARYDVGPGQPIKVELEDGREMKLIGKAGCEAGIHSSYFDPYPHQLAFDLTPGLKLPTNLLMQAESEEDLRWLAAFAMYITSSSEAESRRIKARLAAAPGLAGHIVLAHVPGGGWFSGRYVSKAILHFGLDGIYLSAAEFATREIHSMGGDPSRGVEMFARAQAKNLPVGDIVMSADDLSKIRILAVALKSGLASRASYERPSTKAN